MQDKILTTKTLVATALGAALFFVFFSYIKIPSPVPNTDFQLAYGLSAFFAAIFGPVAGFLVPFIGHALSDTVIYGSPWWSWIIASGVTGLITSVAYFVIDYNDSDFTTKEIVFFNVIQIVGNIVAWLLIAPTLDIMIYHESVQLVSTQGIIATIMNSISVGIVGTALIFAYKKRIVKAGSLD